MGCATTPKERDMFQIHSMYNDEILNERKVELAKEVFGPNYVSHDPGRPDIGVEDMLQFFMSIFEAFPDMKWIVLNRFVSGNMMTIHFEATGTHKKEFMGIPATNRKIVFTGLTMHRFEGEKIAESWNYADIMGMMAQLTGERFAAT